MDEEKKIKSIIKDRSAYHDYEVIKNESTNTILIVDYNRATCINIDYICSVEVIRGCLVVNTQNRLYDIGRYETLEELDRAFSCLISLLYKRY